MQLLADQDVYRITIEWLRKEGHDVLTVKQVGMERASDKAFLRGGTPSASNPLLTMGK